jgi:pimeloyl-ACP methyl ester carboxylesterase
MYRSKPGAIQGSPGSTLGANEGRVRQELRAVAKKKNPISALCQAAQMFTRNKPAPNADTPSDSEFGTAFADLSVTGKATFAKFVELHPTAATLRANSECTGAADTALETALDRAYAVASALRLPHNSAARKRLHWIAVSGEDDQPYRPVNVPSTEFPQFNVKVDVPKWGISVNTRYMIAHRKPPTFPAAAAPLVDGGARRRVAGDALPAIAADAQVLLFIHGMDSRLEEGVDLSEAMQKLPDGKNWTIISLDLPTSGYADNIDPGRISAASDVSCHNTPVVDFIEDFIVAFVNSVDSQVQGQLKPKIQAVVGGSLGGNMSMRLGRRANTAWVRHVVPWSPAAIWPSMIAQKECAACGCDTGWDETKDRAVNLALRWSGRSGGGERFLPKNETPELRRELFYGAFDWEGGLLVEIFAGKGHMPQAGCWFSDEWRCKEAVLLAARLDRQETYNANFRAWHWRLGAEQLAFSQQQFSPGTKEPLYLKNTKPMLLFAGYDDVCASLGEHTRKVAEKMVNTPGYARFLRRTGHSLDNEHPGWVAQEIATFLTRKW